MIDQEDFSELDPELRPFLYTNPVIGPSLRHPLVCMPSLNAKLPPDFEFANMIQLVNAALRQKKEQKQSAINERGWFTYVFLHERFYRTEALIECIRFNEYDLAALWELVREVWADSENVYGQADTWHQIWSHACSQKWTAMTPVERSTLRRLPNAIKVWRGVSNFDAVRGMSWTLSRKKAEWFARRWSGPDGPILVRAQVNKADVCTYLEGRNEHEIVALPHHVSVLEMHPLT
ncbi:hypothetical protein [Methylobacterium frigidaeris]|uniref:hypothetical protein n=1 Tax=Methylobacterium frigidaeris TaxID=2038277 RepID=UPI001EE09EA1|nr:hypothetical protein [Methylobacterium frigidaeris]